MTPPVAADAPELPGYRYVEHLGSGGFADVFLYEQRLPRRRVAVKVLHADDLARDTRSQFVAEANLMAQLSAHPYIVTIFHADVAADGRPYFVMEYCSGPSLATRLKRAPFGVEEALRTGVRLASAVATAHAAGILHRDIKPANVLTNDYGWPALTDFGISSTLEGEVPVHTMTISRGGADGTGTGQTAVGLSVPWSPPELFDDELRPDTRSDVFALAATVHSLLAGRSPYEIPGRSNGTLDLMGRIERGAITPIGRTDVPRSLEDVLRRSMSVRREDRHQSAVEFARALQRIELELGYSPTSIEVPSVVAEREAARAASGAPAGPDDVGGSDGQDSAEETRARVVQQVVAQPGAEATRMRAPAVIDPQPSPAVDDRTVVRRPGSAAPVAPAATVANAPSRFVEETVVRTKTAPPEPVARRSRTGLVVGVVAGLLVAAAVTVGVVVSMNTSLGEPAAPSPTAETGEDAVVGATVPAPVVAPGVVSADGTTATFAVSHEGAEDGDRYRWERADGVGDVQVADGPEIVVEGLAPGQVLCIDVSVQRGSKLSEPTRGCTP
ncbi:serine/threonine-protein kinase [Agromyces sp. MMS24-K17]|uniref:serine/threonine-protein kinase n=1 Tax=Agromyces sp. MMS24-K17 TaxID=3372850 RepID=UPI00375534D8